VGDEDAGIDAMKTIALSIISAGACLAAIGNFRVLGTSATQALIAYTAPDGNACTIQVSQSAGLTPLALDVDPGTFANSNFDLSRAGTVTAGLINAFFDILELLVVRLTLLILLVLGAYTLIRGHLIRGHDLG
jgi:hypothetical protein